MGRDRRHVRVVCAIVGWRKLSPGSPAKTIRPEPNRGPGWPQRRRVCLRPDHPSTGRTTQADARARTRYWVHCTSGGEDGEKVVWRG